MTDDTAIDMHAHYYGGLVDRLRRRSSRPCVAPDAEGRAVLHAMTASTVMSPAYTDLPTRLSFMDRSRIATQLLTFPGALGIDVMPIHEIGEDIAAYNDHLADICAKSGGRFAGLAGLPLADVDRAAAELARARRVLRLQGAILPGNFFLTIESARLLDPVLRTADETGALLMIHPGLMPGESAPASYADTSVLRASALQLQASLAQMGLTVFAAELCAAYPRVVFQLVNLGGTLPFVLERMDAVARSRPPHRPFPAATLRSLVYDCASLGPRALELAVRVIGADRIMVGSDYPIFESDPVRETVAAADISDKDRRSVLRDTAAGVLAHLAQDGRRRFV